MLCPRRAAAWRSRSIAWSSRSLETLRLARATRMRPALWLMRTAWARLPRCLTQRSPPSTSATSAAPAPLHPATRRHPPDPCSCTSRTQSHAARRRLPREPASAGWSTLTSRLSRRACWSCWRRPVARRVAACPSRPSSHPRRETRAGRRSRRSAQSAASRSSQPSASRCCARRQTRCQWRRLAGRIQTPPWPSPQTSRRAPWWRPCPPQRSPKCTSHLAC